MLYISRLMVHIRTSSQAKFSRLKVGRSSKTVKICRYTVFDRMYNMVNYFNVTASWMDVHNYIIRYGYTSLMNSRLYMYM